MEPADFTHSEAVDPDGRLRLEIQADQAGSRVDRVLGRALAPHYSRSYLSALLAEGAIKVDGQSVRTSFRVAEGMLIEGELGVLAKSLPEAEDLELKILHEDESVILVDKPQGLVIHPGSGAASGTMVNGLLKLFPELSVVGRADRPGIVHRLDRETTGIMVVARTNDAARSLVNQFKAKTVRKQYAAVVWGEMPFDSDWIDLPIGQHPRKPQRRAVVAEGGQAASTFYEVRQRLGVASVLDVSPRTGRTHQIRVHLDHLGFPILVDPAYGPGAQESWRRWVAKREEKGLRVPILARQALHARTLAFRHPSSNEEVCFESPLPPDMADLVEVLEEAASAD
jgi:23S rRNA pseudouridine1911/1915/1917 synthase